MKEEFKKKGSKEYSLMVKPVSSTHVIVVRFCLLLCLCSLIGKAFAWSAIDASSILDVGNFVFFILWKMFPRNNFYNRLCRTYINILYIYIYYIYINLDTAFGRFIYKYFNMKSIYRFWVSRLMVKTIAF